MLFWALVLSSSAMTLANARALEARGGVQTSAVCGGQFSWMNNQEQQTPCLAAAWLLGACQGGTWNVPALPDANHHYTPPNGSFATVCGCSWAAYNLQQACAFCQGSNFDSAIFNWDPWSTGCSGSELTNGSSWPSSVVIPEETSIPYWAAQNPTSWANHRFDPVSAQNLASQNQPDVTSQTITTTSKKSSNTGAIVGGVVGGIVAIAAIVAAVLFYRKKQNASEKYQETASVAPVMANLYPGTPGIESLYPTSAVSPGPSVDSTDPTRPPMNAFHSSYNNYQPSLVPTSPTNSAIYSVSPLSPNSSTTPTRGHGHTISSVSGLSTPGGVGQPAVEGMISPFILPPVNEDSRADISSLDIDNSPVGRSRINPPAYTPSIHSNVTSISPPPEKQAYRSRNNNFSPGSLAMSVDGPGSSAGAPSVSGGMGGIMTSSAVSSPPPTEVPDDASEAPLSTNIGDIGHNEAVRRPTMSVVNSTDKATASAPPPAETDQWGFPRDRKQ